MKIVLEPIGIVHSPFKKKEDIARERCIDAHGFEDVVGEVEVFKKYQEGLSDIDGFSHLILIFAFHKSKEKKLTAHPPFDGKERGVFATRSPRRPNPIGMTVARFLGREGNVLRVSGIDMIEGTPILDIKPYTTRDQKEGIALGWLEQHRKKVPKGEII